MASIRIHERVLDRRLDAFSAYRALRGAGPALLLDGHAPGAPLATRAYVLFDPLEVIELPAGSDAGIEPAAASPFAGLQRRLDALGRCAAQGGRFRGGAAGFFSYDLGRRLERLPATARRDSEAPDLWLGIFDRGLEIDFATGAATLFVAEREAGGRVAGAAGVREAFDEAETQLAARAPAGAPESEDPPPPERELVSNFDRGRYVAAVGEARERILAGEIYQVNLAQRFCTDFPSGRDAADVLYARLRATNPAPFAALVDTGTVRVLSCSPESFLRREGGSVTTRPIKGTRPRSGDPARDARARAELEESAKERAELAMIVDLERNDLGRVARFGGVEVVDPGRLEAYPTVFHRTAEVRARLRADVDTATLLHATFPGGSVTGCPKIRAMEIIEELEGLRRGLFTGAIGWIGFDGDLDLSIVIRTVILEGGRAHFHVGSGIVLDSDPAAEHEETLVKGRALAATLGARL